MKAKVFANALRHIKSAALHIKIAMTLTSNTLSHDTKIFSTDA